MPEQHSIVVIGGGISGLATAWWLNNAGLDVVLLERDSRVGGTIQTVRDNGWLVELGPNSALETTPLFQDLFVGLGIVDEVLYASKKANRRYIVRNGKLHPIPMSAGAFFRSKLWSLRGKLQLFKEPFVGRAVREETIAEFVTRRLGQEFLDYAINPFVAGVFAGDPEKLSVQAAFPKLYALEKNYGSLIKGQLLGIRERKKRAEKAKDRAQMFSFKNGMQTLPLAIARSLGSNVKTDTQVEKIVETANGSSKRYEIHASQHGKRSTLIADSVVVAVPSYAAAEVIGIADQSLATALKQIYYPPVAEIFLGYKNGDISRTLDGFGFLVPEKEHRTILGTIWTSTIFPYRAPEGMAALTTFVGGSRQPELLERDERELVELVSLELHDIMQLKGSPVYSRVTRWERAIPQYHLGHLSIVERLETFERQHPGFFFTGNYRGGISVGDCVINSKTLANRVSEFIQKLPVAVAV